MRYSTLIILFISCCSGAIAQELQNVSDTVNHFQIGVPVGWKYGVPADRSLAFMALRQKESEQDVPRENFNINILRRREADLDQTYVEFLKAIGKADGFEVVEQGEKVIHLRKYKYLIETHNNRISGERMCNYVVLGNKDGDVIILTMVTTMKNFADFKKLFESIASSLQY